MSVVCVSVPAYRLAVARLTKPNVDLADPIILADRLERGRVVECTPAAAALGARPGMTLVQAHAVAHEARTVLADPAAEARVWGELLEALDSVSPLVEDGGVGRAFIEMHGISGDAQAWFGTARGALAALDLPLRLGLGPNRFVAAVAARLGDGAVCGGDPAKFVAPLPLDVLNLDLALIERLRLLGVETLGDMAALPHGPFVRRFGAEAAAWHDRARGIDERPLRPRTRALRIDWTLYGEGEASSEEQVLFALRTLVGRVVDDLAAAGKRAGRLVLHLECEDGETRELRVRIAQPTAVPGTLFELLRARLEGVVMTAPVVGLRLAAEELAGGAVALSLFAGNDPDPEAVAVVLARLDAAFGEGNALRARVLSGSCLENRFAFDSFTAESLGTNGLPIAPPPLRSTGTVQLRLVKPRPVDVRLADGSPRLVGSPPQTVLETAGPWRTADGWWAGISATKCGSALTRDEYDVWLEDGSLLRIAREGEAWTIRGVYD